MSLGAWLWHHDGLVTAAQLAVWGGAMAAAAPRLRDAWGQLERAARWTLPVLAVVGAALCLWPIPSLTEFSALGHEATYLDCFTGASPPGNDFGWEPYVTYPLIRWIYWALGGVFGREGHVVPLLFNVACRGLGVFVGGWLAAVLLRSSRAGIAAAALLALHSVHAFWGAALYNVALPHLLVQTCVLLALIAWRTGSLAAFCAAAASGSLVVAGRVEWGLLAPSLAVLLAGLGPAWGRHEGVKKPGFWAAPLAIAGAFAVTLFLGEGQLTEQGGYHGISGYLQTIGHQAGILAVFEPFGQGVGLMGAAMGLILWGSTRGWRPVLGVVGFGLLAHLGLSTFNDYSFRHAMLPGLVLVWGLAAAETLDDPKRRLGAHLIVAAGLLMGAWNLAITADRYYATPEDFVAGHPGFATLPEVPAAQVEASGCYLITDNELLWQLGLAGSHFNLMDPGEAVKRWRHHGCITWIFDAPNWRHDGLAVRVRALKLQHWFDWDEVGWTQFDDGNAGVLLSMTSPPWGVADDEPVPPTDVMLPWEQEPEDEPR